MSRARNLADLLDSNGDVVSGALDNVPAADLVNDTSPQLGGDLDGQSYKITTDGNIGVGSGATTGGLSVYRNAHSTTFTNPHIFLRNGNNTTGDKALITTGFTADIGAGFTPVAFGGLNVNAASGVRDGAFAVYVADNDNVDLATDERMRVTESGVDVTGTVTADEFDPSGFPSGTVVQKQHWVLSTHNATSTTSGWMEVTSGNRPQITPVHSNSKFIIECFVNHWGDVDNDGHGYVTARLVLERYVNGSYTNYMYDKSSIIDRGGQSRTRHQVFVEADNSLSLGNTYQYQIHAQLSYTSNGRAYNINTVPSYVVISEVVN